MFIRFLDSKSIIPCEVIPSGNVVILRFEENVVVDTSGFDVFLDTEGEYNIGGEFYHGFKTIYRNDDSTAKYNGYQLSNNGSIYNEEVNEGTLQQADPKLTEEEKAEIERQKEIAELKSKIAALKAELQETDYIFVKSYEMSLIGETPTEYDFESLHTERQGIRDEINRLEEELLTYQVD